ncbi:hypothetical protein NZL45_004102 [Escherichia coli]|uniref:hypothetical protein n=2 Tax=Escherichia coli TaxID=562 RepID=UPI00025CA6C3|nr:hypothetical protein [Escherichia coli]EFA8286512.1 hypothetical protein [Escherichia coli O157]EEW4293572.1 hypothetical protein [Escherichia coli]EEZ5825394.1 hypothetical protein [Escherichia coli]EFG4663427.1 hypothetical protein [Escherichia coli]EFH7028255.1 hypothetical protein [Escherichia coli]
MKQMSLIEMDGFLKGKCIPCDLKVNETNAEYLVRKFAEAEAKCAALAAENAELKSVHPQPFGAEMMKALDEYEKHQDEVPETGMLNAFFILRDSIRVETPATDSFLSEVRAQGVEMMREHPSIKLCSLTHICDELAAQLRKGGNQ